MDSVLYYDKRAEDYARRTQQLDMAALYEVVLPLVIPGGRILDAGCGSGRDSKVFQDKGYDVVPLEPAQALADIAETYVGVPVVRKRFLDLEYVEEFDAVWACSSFLHVPQHEADEVISRFWDALKEGGMLYLSVRQGQGETVYAETNRLYCDYDENALSALFNEGWDVLNIWQSEDVRAGYESRPWLNLLARKID